MKEFEGDLKKTFSIKKKVVKKPGFWNPCRILNKIGIFFRTLYGTVPRTPFFLASRAPVATHPLTTRPCYNPPPHSEPPLPPN